LDFAGGFCHDLFGYPFALPGEEGANGDREIPVRNVHGLVKRIGRASKSVGKASKQVSKDVDQLGDDVERVGKALS
jgi:hypothetical protein